MGETLRRRRQLLAAIKETTGHQPREVDARAAARLLCLARHICVVGQWEDAPRHRGLFTTLAAMFGDQFSFLICEPAYTPSLPRPIIESAYGRVRRPAQRVYQEHFLAFVPDTPGNRVAIDGLIRQTGADVGELRLEFFKEPGPVIVLDSARVQEAAALMMQSLKSLYEGTAWDLSTGRN